ncbi:hypothetical protein NC653_002133 [Populus alba x Populus x berolinensis]|uniref:Uncharacterized protein n=1 Tax=Populus alba x Populus x berolinensis TaxID=444605 RepID=A0AAD6RN72_9ROSI|nr:hypothetical protein NC653_002133 [Populus alba x Populus x berolinensis]
MCGKVLIVPTMIILLHLESYPCKCVDFSNHRQFLFPVSLTFMNFPLGICRRVD